MTDYVGGSSTAGTKLKAVSGWNAHTTYGNGTDDYGFSALPGGNGNSNGSFSDVGNDGDWWSSSELSLGFAWLRDMLYSNGDVRKFTYSESYLFSVRCLDTSDVSVVTNSSAITNSYAIGNIFGDDYVGGIIGNGGTIENSYFVGNATGAGSNIGGISGANTTATNSYCNSDSVTTSNSIGTHKSTAEMKTQSIYSKWDFQDTWIMLSNANEGYPIFFNEKNFAHGKTTISIIEPQQYTYTTQPIEPSVTITNFKNDTLKRGTDYTVKYDSNTNVGIATITVTGKDDYIGSLSINFEIDQAEGECSVIMGGFKASGTTSNPEPHTSTNTYVGVIYMYNNAEGTSYYSGQNQPSNPGNYEVTATFQETRNYKQCVTEPYPFSIYSNDINLIDVQWSPSCDTTFTYNGTQQSPQPSSNVYEVMLTGGAGTKAGTYTATANFATSQSNAAIRNPACFYTIAKKTLQVEWTADSVFTYNKMDQSPRASLVMPEPGVEFEYTNRKSSVGKYEGGDGVRVDIMDKSIADNYILANRIKNYEILKKDLTPYFTAVYPEDFPPSADTLWVSHEVFADSTLLLEVLEDLIDYDGFATDTVKKETDDATVLKGKAKVKIKYDDDEDGNSQGSKSFLAKRVETTQKATATIITDNVSADNYKPLVRPTAIVILATVVEDDNAPQIFCKRNSKYAEIGRNTCGAIGGEVFEELSCVIDATCTQITANFSLNACASLDGEPVPTCNGTPIPYTPNPIPKTQKIHAYTIGNTIILQNVPKDAKVQLYNLNGKLIYSANSGNSQILKILVQTKGMYIVKAGKQTLRIAVTHRSLP